MILDAALRLVATGGPRAVTHRAVAAEAGVPLAATTYYFASRDDLIAQALVESAEQDVARLRGPDPPGVVELLLGDLEGDRPGLIASYELWLEAARRPELRPAARRVTETYVAAARELAGDDVDARLLVAALEGLCLEGMTGGMEADEIRAAIERLLAALRRSDAAPAAERRD